jgi:hypothetical protein
VKKCGKEFNSKSHYTQHQKRKTPCVINNNESKIEEKLIKLNISLSSSAAVQTTNKITIDTSTFNEIKNIMMKH